MDLPKMLQIPPSIEECIYLMRSYVYIDKYSGEVHIRELSPYLAPGFILGVCAQIPFLYELVQPYIQDVLSGNIVEVAANDMYKQEMACNEFVASQLLFYEYTPVDCDFVLAVLLHAIIQSMYGRPNVNFRAQIEESVNNIASMANIFPMTFFLPRTFRHIMKTTLLSVPDLRIRIMSLLCQNNFYQHGTVWSLVKRYIWIQVRNFHMGTFMMIGQWYEAREKTLAHVDGEILDEMRKYQHVVDEMKKIAHEQGYSLGTFRILNPKSMLPYLRQFPCSAYCAIEWKKKKDPRWATYQNDFDRFGVDTESLDRLMSVTVKTTLKRRLNDEEIQQISTKRFKALETEYTRNDDEDCQDEDEDGDNHSDGNGHGNDQGDGNSQNDNDGEDKNNIQIGSEDESGGNGQDDGNGQESDGNNQVNINENNENVQNDENVSSPKVEEQPVIPGDETDESKLENFQQSHPHYEIAA